MHLLLNLNHGPLVDSHP